METALPVARPMPRPTHIVTVLTPDRPGIVNALVETLAREGVPHLGISQTVLGGAFTIALSLAVPGEREAGEVRDALLAALDEGSSGKDRSASASLLALDEGEPARSSRPRYVLTAIGDARVGAVRDITRIVLAHGGSFSDFSSETVAGRLQLLAEVELPDETVLGSLQDALREASEEPALAVRLQHPRLFGATNEIAFRRGRS